MATLHYYPQYERLDFIGIDGMPVCAYYGIYAQCKVTMMENSIEDVNIVYCYDSKLNE
jgi:hypothetical protein